MELRACWDLRALWLGEAPKTIKGRCSMIRFMFSCNKYLLSIYNEGRKPTQVLGVSQSRPTWSMSSLSYRIILVGPIQ